MQGGKIGIVGKSPLLDYITASITLCFGVFFVLVLHCDGHLKKSQKKKKIKNEDHENLQHDFAHYF